MELNLNKCKHMHFSRRCDVVNSYNFINHKLELVNIIMDLDILLGTKLNFIQHITMSVNKARSIWAFIKRWSKEFNDPAITKHLYITLVRPILEYGSIIWDPYYNVHIEQIESVQKQFLIFCLKDVYRDFLSLPSYSTRLSILNLPTLKSRRIMLNISFMINLLNGAINSEFLLNRLYLNAPQHHLRFYNPIAVRTYRTNFAMCDPFQKLCRCFNEMYSINCL